MFSTTTATSNKKYKQKVKSPFKPKHPKISVESLPKISSPQPVSKRNLTKDMSIISSVHHNSSSVSNIHQIDNITEHSHLSPNLHKTQVKPSMVDSIRKIQESQVKHKSMVQPASRNNLMIKKDIVKYFSRIKQNTPSYYYFKKRNPGVMDYIFKEHSGKYGPFGDLRLYFGDFQNFKNEQLECIKEINKNLLVVLAKDQLSKMIRKRPRPKEIIECTSMKKLSVDNNDRHILDYQTAFKSK